MSTYNIRNINGPANLGDHGRIEVNQQGADPAAVLRLAGQLVERLSTEKPALVPQAQIIQGELAEAAEGRQANRGRIRSALETIGVGVTAGGGGLALAQQISHALGL